MSAGPVGECPATGSTGNTPYRRRDSLMIATRLFHVPVACPPRHSPRTGSPHAPGLSLPEACIFIPINPETTPGFMPTNPKPCRESTSPWTWTHLSYEAFFQPQKPADSKGSLAKYAAMIGSKILSPWHGLP